ncbi:DNA cytosine methyltransferase [Streptomyces sp. MAR4 CNX-425]|uniref:DNA cytosine methyltransferase n=1 Tax=Streptomyces sp. MAR4 CNX-425 TaxID=3406343 RepID=UPI003B510F09
MCGFEIVDLFAGPGGLDVAAHCLGIPVTGIELDDDACATRAAFAEAKDGDGPRMITKPGDVRDFDPLDYKTANVLAAGPPCQTFSVAGKGTGRRNLDQVTAFIRRMAEEEDVTKELDDLADVRTGLVLEPLKWVLARKNNNPFEVVILEQVPAVLPVWKEMVAVLEKLDYHADAQILYTEDYGVPQTRKRAVLIARKKGGVNFPESTHQRYRKGHPPVAAKDHPKKLAPWVSMGEVLKRGSFTIVSNYGSGRDPKNRGRRDHTKPAFTVTGKVGRNKIIGPDGRDLGRLDEREAGLLQTFPRDYPWRGKDVQQQIGNAIPPLLAAHILITALGLPARRRGAVLGYNGF